MSKLDCFLINKIQEIEAEILLNNNLYYLIGPISDIFFSPYVKDLDIKYEVLEKVWFFLLSIFMENRSYENKFNAIFTMLHIHTYISNNNIHLPLDELTEWFENHKNNESEAELLDFVDSIIHNV